MKGVGVLLLIVGCLIAAVGLILLLAPKVPWLGHLPGDIHIEGENSSFHFPVVTCLVVSIVLSIALNFVLRVLR